MSTTTAIRSGYDTWVSPGDPAAKHPKDNRIRVSSSADGFLYLPLGPELRDVTIQSAKLHLWGQGDDWGSQTLTVRRIAEKWDASTLRWNARPEVVGAAATLTRGNPVNPTEWVVDVTELVQAYASGARWYGFRLSFTSSVDRGFRSLNAPGRSPWLEVTWTDSPGAPVDLAPSGGRAVSVSRPVLSWSNENSPDGTTITAFQVQIDPAANGTTPAFASGTVVTDLAEYDLSQTDYPGLAFGASTQWRVRVLDGAGLWSEWSDWSAFVRAEKGVVTITTPGATVAEFTPPVAWATTFAQSAWRVQIRDMDGVVLHDTGRKAGTTQEYTFPAKDSISGRPILVDARDYELRVFSWDDVEREATPGDPAYAEAAGIFHYADDPTPDPVTSLVAAQVDDTPYVDLTWNRATTPDSWTVLDNGRVVATAVGGADLLVSGTSYLFRYKDAEPGAHVFQVKPTVNGLTADSPTATLTPTSTGLWIMGPDDIDVLVGVDDGFGNYAMPDRATTFDLPGSRTPVRITQSVSGLRGEVRGVLQTWSGRDVEEWRDRLLELKKRAGEGVTLFIGEEVVRAQIFDIVVEPAQMLGPNLKVRPVSFSFFQVGAIDWLD